MKYSYGFYYINNMDFSATPIPANNTQTNSAMEQVIWDNYDVSLVSTSSKDFKSNDNQYGTTVVCIQAVWAGLTGTINGTLQLIQSNDGVNFDVINTAQNISGASGSMSLKETFFSGKYIGIRYTKGSITGGTISFYLLAKNG